MKDNSDEKLKILEILRETPFISYVAKKIGSSRSTIYRWMESDSKFKENVNKSITEGHCRLSDLAEMNLIKRIEKGELGAIKYYLSHNNRRYLPRKSGIEPVKELTPGETCQSCGLEHPTVLSNEEAFWIMEDLSTILGYKINKIEKEDKK